MPPVSLSVGGRLAGGSRGGRRTGCARAAASPGLGHDRAVSEHNDQSQGADDDHDQGDHVQAVVADAGVEDDGNKRGGGNRADVAEGSEQARRRADLIGGDQGNAFRWAPG